MTHIQLKKKKSFILTFADLDGIFLPFRISINAIYSSIKYMFSTGGFRLIGRLRH